MKKNTIYGLEKCDTCKKARNWLTRKGVVFDFVDYREQPVAAPALKAWAAQLGGFGNLINRASTTWRALPDARKSPLSAPEWTLLIKEYPALIKRPVLVLADDSVSVGFSDKLFAQRLAAKG
jgi:Spx/MgsR family transcriptional regulator